MTEDARRQIGLLVLADLAPADEVQRASLRDSHAPGIDGHAAWMADQERYRRDRAGQIRPFMVLIREDGSPIGEGWPEERVIWIGPRPTTLDFYLGWEIASLKSLQELAFQAFSASYLAAQAERAELLLEAGIRACLDASIAVRSLLAAGIRRAKFRATAVAQWLAEQPLSRLSCVLASGGQTALHAPLN